MGQIAKKISQGSWRGRLRSTISDKWKGSATHKESSLHQIAPYIGKIKSSMAATLISLFTRKSETLYDPFSGSGTIALEGWAAGRNVIANDLSPYGFVLGRAKLFPFLSTEEAMAEIDAVAKNVRTLSPRMDLDKIPEWVWSFFHPETLKETVTWFQILKSRRSYFLLSCLLGILHHQRPGFLSYPSSHTVPYLRERKFPRHLYPQLYQYRPVRERLEKKVSRALGRLPPMDPDLFRECRQRNAAAFAPGRKIDAIITSPPYMRQLDYGRDNRLRLWFLGIRNWKLLDQRISPSEAQFLRLIRSCLELWHHCLTPRGFCVLVLGNVMCKSYGMDLPDAIIRIATKELGTYSVVWTHTESIPELRRVRRTCSGTLKETILVLGNRGG